MITSTDKFGNAQLQDDDVLFTDDGTSDNNNSMVI